MLGFNKKREKKVETRNKIIQLYQDKYLLKRFFSSLEQIKVVAYDNVF